MCSSKRHKMYCLCSSSKTWINQKSIYLASIQSRYIEHQPNTNAHNINPKSMHIATDFLLDGLLGAENFHPSQYASDLSFCAEPKAKSQNPSSQKIILALRERVTIANSGWGQTKTLSPTPHPFGGYLFKKREGFLRLLNSGFCNCGQALRAEWHEGGVRDWKKTSSLKCASPNGKNWLPLFTIKDMNQSKINLPSVNPKPIHRASTQYQCT